ncbi:phage tail protein [Pseudomonas sp. Marseille-Q5117]|uniref:phage tail-collar fiber domain-containing protein n=3 Tax=unclassified Pseudomonas TaxID=196821 RepID=UPI0021C837B9|nr:phage tail protein [Pseudomonas sp. Marseille-Q5117]
MIDANSQFFAILTNVGMAKQANADALGIPWLITQMGVGDANPNGLADPPNPVPSASQTKLLNEWRRKPLNQLKIDPVNPAVIIAEQIIPADEGGKWIREIGLYDADGDLVAVANCAPSFKPLLSQGSGRTQIVRMNFIVTSTGNIQLKIDPAIVLASRAYVDAAILEVLPKNKAAGQYTRVKVNDRGVFVFGDNPETLAGMGIKDTYTKTEIEAMLAQASALPIGATVAFPLNKVAPGFLELDGSVKSIAVYPDLAAFLGTAFNKGDEGAGNFRLPESRGEFLRGWDHGRGVDAGRVIGSFQADALKTHFHYLPTESGGNQASDPAGINPTSVLKDNPVDWLARTAGDNPTFNTLGNPRTYSAGAEVETRPRNMAVVWCIKAWNAPINQGVIDIGALEQRVNENEFGRLLNIQKFTASGTYIPTPGMKKVRVRIVGGGAGSGGASATTASQVAASGGGSAGSYAESLLTAADVGASQSVIVGLGGVAGTASGTSGTSGGSGGATSVGALLSAPGGLGSIFSIAISTASQALLVGGYPGAQASGGSIVNMPGAPGSPGIAVSGSTLAGHGGSGPLGSGGSGYGIGAAIQVGTGYGAGAGGVANGPSAVARNGAPGSAGVAIFEEYA